jgi:hypothetical protein
VEFGSFATEGRAREIEQLRVEISGRKRHVIWSDTGDWTISEKLAGEVEALKAQTRPRGIIVDDGRMDLYHCPCPGFHWDSELTRIHSLS